MELRETEDSLLCKGFLWAEPTPGAVQRGLGHREDLPALIQIHHSVSAQREGWVCKKQGRQLQQA